MKRIAIHQPNFFPHLQFFKKMEMADVFVILSHCQFEKNGYQNRFQMNGKWLTMSTSKKLSSIINKKYKEPIDDWLKIKRRLKPRELDGYDRFIGPRLSITNTAIIREIARKLRIKTEIVNDYKTGLTGSQRLVDLCKKHGCDEYISGPSGSGYMDTSYFRKADIKIIYQMPETSVPILEEV